METDSAENAERILRRLEVPCSFGVWERTNISFCATHHHQPLSIQAYYINNEETSILQEPSSTMLFSARSISLIINILQLYPTINEYVHSQRYVSM